jgi:hypothetical protein
MPPAYVKPYVKRQKNDMADAEAICEAVTRANMRFVPTKTPEQQSCLAASRSRPALHFLQRIRMSRLSDRVDWPLQALPMPRNFPPRRFVECAIEHGIDNRGQRGPLVTIGAVSVCRDSLAFRLFQM